MCTRSSSGIGGTQTTKDAVWFSLSSHGLDKGSGAGDFLLACKDFIGATVRG